MSVINLINFNLKLLVCNVKGQEHLILKDFSFFSQITSECELPGGIYLGPASLSCPVRD